MFERFTDTAIKVIRLAQEEARRLGHNFIGTEQILLGLIGEGNGVAAKVLNSLGVSLKEAREEVEKIIGRGSGFAVVEFPSPQGASVFLICPGRSSHTRAGLHWHRTLASGLIRDGEGVAAKVLLNVGVDSIEVRAKVFRCLTRQHLLRVILTTSAKRHQPSTNVAPT
jgi:ATP-dependent Clp protease ATP-binding subunit ClpC